MNLSQVIFDKPEVIYLFALVPLFIFLFVLLFRFRRKALERFASQEMLSKALFFPSKRNRIFQIMCLLCAWIFTIFALMQPKGHASYVEEQRLFPSPASREPEHMTFSLKRKAHDVMFLIDASASMGATDTRIGKSRLEYGKEIVDHIISQLQGESVALYAFTSEVIPLVSATPDYLFLRMMLDRLNINEGNTSGTDFLKTLTFVENRLVNEPREKMKTLVILSDGGDTTFEGLQGEQRIQREQAILNTIKDPLEENLRLIVIGLGTKEGSDAPNVAYQEQPIHVRLEEQLLRRLSEKGRGIYIRANDETPPNIAQQVNEFILKAPPIYEQKKVTLNVTTLDHSDNMIFDLYFQYPLGIAIFFLALALLIPETKKRAKT